MTHAKILHVSKHVNYEFGDYDTCQNGHGYNHFCTIWHMSMQTPFHLELVHTCEKKVHAVIPVPNWTGLKETLVEYETKKRLPTIIIVHREVEIKSRPRKSPRVVIIESFFWRGGAWGSFQASKRPLRCRRRQLLPRCTYVKFLQRREMVPGYQTL